MATVAAPLPDLDLEAELAALQKTLQLVEGNSLPLPELIVAVEQASERIRRCRHYLQAAELRIQQVTSIDANGNIEAEGFA
jgi:exodeoxyribonuclease VII small subunit